MSTNINISILGLFLRFVSISKKPRKQHTPEFCNKALKIAERIGVAAASRELSLY